MDNAYQLHQTYGISGQRSFLFDTRTDGPNDTVDNSFEVRNVALLRVKFLLDVTWLCDFEWTNISWRLERSSFPDD
jgi:hypothetical protein